jgi:hypothetical protein
MSKMMINASILEKIDALPDSLQTEVLHYVEFLLEKYEKNSHQNEPTQNLPIAETIKGTSILHIPHNFDLPFQDLNEYIR